MHAHCEFLANRHIHCSAEYSLRNAALHKPAKTTQKDTAQNKQDNIQVLSYMETLFYFRNLLPFDKKIVFNC